MWFLRAEKPAARTLRLRHGPALAEASDVLSFLPVAAHDGTGSAQAGDPRRGAEDEEGAEEEGPEDPQEGQALRALLLREALVTGALRTDLGSETLDEASLQIGSVLNQGTCVCPDGPCQCGCEVERAS